MYQNAIFICISWYSKICRFPMKKCWCQQNSRVASRDSYIFSIVLGWGITVPSFIIAGYVWQIVGRGGGFLVPPHAWAAPKKSILNRFKKETPTQVISWEFCKISKNTFLQNISGRLLLTFHVIPYNSSGKYGHLRLFYTIPSQTQTLISAIPFLT